MSKAWRFLRRATALGVGALLLAFTVAWWWLTGSLPVLDGKRYVSGIQAPLRISRDALGVTVIDATTRTDIAFATGFVHAQERFFQMDLQRRSAAGELAALLGPAALDYDRDVRVHRFRWRAGRNFELLDEASRNLLSAYATGVNAGLQALPRRPFEYLLLGTEPEPWRNEDALLTVMSMFLVLQDDRGRFERGLGLMADLLPHDLYRFFAQQGGEWDAPLDGAPFEPEPLPVNGFSTLLDDAAPLAYFPVRDDDAIAGSNNWAVSGRFTSHGGALVANDMHLPLRVPNIWYRVAWVHPDTGRLVSGISLPGMPIMVAGSNGQVAWGFTNTQGDWSDVVILETAEEGQAYRTPEGTEPFRYYEESIGVKGGEPVVQRVQETRWGPVIGTNHRGQLLALRWVAHDPEGVNTGGLAMETVDSVAAAVRFGPRYGIPHQNLVMGDAKGAIAWTIAGPVPDRKGIDGRLPERWSEGGHWDGYLDTDRHPSIENPADGRLWSANSRVVSGAPFRLIGQQGAALGARQRQIRDALLEREAFDEADMLALQLDDRALFLSRWRDHLLALLEGLPENEPAVRARAYVANWSGRADRDDVGYRLVRGFRLKTIELVTAPLMTILLKADPEFRPWHINRQFEYPVWALVREQPAHLLNPDFGSWAELQREALRQVLEPLLEDGDLGDDTWGEANRLAIRHPLANALPPLRWWLSMPDEPMSGDSHMPRVQRPVHGASERYAVSPGRESHAYFHMATGQSAHPLSPFFGEGHEDWVTGRPSPWLAGETRHELYLEPHRD